MKLIKHLSLIIPFLLLVLVGCNLDELDKEGELNISPELLIPIGSYEFSISSFVEDLGDSDLDLGNTSTGTYQFKYRDTTIFTSGDDFVNITDFNESATVPIPGFTNPLPISFDSSIAGTPLPIGFNTEDNDAGAGADNDNIDSILFNGGILNININNASSATMEVRLSSDDLLGQSARDSFSIVIPIGPSTSKDTTVSLTDKVILFDGSNNFEVTPIITIKVGASETISAGDLDITVSLDANSPSLDIDAVFGTFGLDAITLQSTTLDFDALDDFRDAGVGIEGTSLELTVTSDFGVPLTVDFSGFEATYPSAANIPFNYTGANTIPAASTFGGTADTVFSFNSTSSDIDDIINAIPSGFLLPTSATAGNRSPNSFLRSNSTIEIISEAIIPLNLSIDDYAVDTISFDLGDISQLDDGEEATLFFNTDNSVPLDGWADIFIRRQDNSLFDLDSASRAFTSSTDTVSFIIERPTSAELAAGETVKQNFEIVLDETSYQELSDGKELLTIIHLTTDDLSEGDTSAVEFNVNGKLDIGVSVGGKFNIKE